MPFRTDIQALRGFAVLLVVFHHAKLDLLEGGYLGVDIFFVISGFLITRMIRQRVEDGTFSFSEFYMRRAKRLLPAAYVVFLVTSILSMALLSISELRDFAYQILGAITFLGNVSLLLQTGYFDSEAALKPLLHVWSLSIEEQYYLILPAAIVFIPRRYWTGMAFLAFLLSLVLCTVVMPMKPSAAFYLLPTRAWEFLIGSLAAFMALKGIQGRRLILSFLFWPAMLVLVFLPIYPAGKGAHPGIDALLICISTAIIILRQHETTALSTVCRMLAKIGDFSYSLYLVHWPIFAFIHNLYIGEPPAWIYVAATVLSFILGFLLYRHIELPARRLELNVNRKLVGATLVSSLTLGLAPLGLAYANTNSADFKQIRQINAGFGPACEFREDFTSKSDCRNSDKPEIMIWGDSFAMHLVTGIASTTGKGVVQATRSMCPPFLTLAPMDGASYGQAWAERCMAFNRSVIDHLAATPAIKVVVLSSPFSQFVSPTYKGRSWRSLEKVEGNYIEKDSSALLAFMALQGTVDELRRIGKKVVVVAPPPSSGLNVGRCLERKMGGRLILDMDQGCDISAAEYQRHMAPVLSFLDEVRHHIVPVISLDPALCKQQTCSTSMEGTIIYRDEQHLSHEGSRKVAQKIGLGSLVISEAN